MLRWALAFLALSIVAALLGFTGVAAGAAAVAEVVFFIFVVLFVAWLVLEATSSEDGR